MSVHVSQFSTPDSFFVDSSSELDRLLQELVNESTDEQITNFDDDISVSESLKKLLLESDEIESELKAPRSVESILGEADGLRDPFIQPHIVTSIPDGSGDILKQFHSHEGGQKCIKIDNYSQTEIQPCITDRCHYKTQYLCLLNRFNVKSAFDSNDSSPHSQRRSVHSPDKRHPHVLQTKPQSTQTYKINDGIDIGIQCGTFPGDENLQDTEARDKYEMALVELKNDFALLKVKHEAQVNELKHQLELKSQPLEPLLTHSELQRQLQQQRKQIEVLTQQNNCHSSKEDDHLDALNVLKRQLADKQRLNINLKKELSVLQKQNAKLERDKSMAVSREKFSRPSSVPREKSLNSKVMTLQIRVGELEKTLEEKENFITHIMQKHREELQALELKQYADDQLLKAKSTMNVSNHQQIDELKSQVKTLQNTVKTYEDKLVNLNRLQFQLEHSNEEKAALESNIAAMQIKLDWCKKALSPKQTLLYEIQEKVYVFQQKANSREQELLDLIQKMRISLAGASYEAENGL